ncbi:MAG: zinc ribbon domain-containing protein [Clostridiales bacterium]|jgi:hypothetical protein|nr:zinc ribbon domain-containing protein [Clostridiales bacterium]
MFCKRCGNTLEDGSFFCDQCGAAVQENAPRETQPAPNAADWHAKTPQETDGGLPIFGILGLVFTIVSLMISLYSFRIVSDLKQNLRDYYAQMDDTSALGQWGGQIVDFFTSGSLTKKRQDVQQMESELTLGVNVMGLGVACAGVAALICFFGVLRNMKKPSAGRALFAAAYIFALFAPALVFYASIILYTITGLLLIGVTVSILGVLFMIIEARRIALRRRFGKNAAGH